MIGCERYDYEMSRYSPHFSFIGSRLGLSICPYLYTIAPTGPRGYQAIADLYC
jgi:hypothetical protein